MPSRFYCPIDILPAKKIAIDSIINPYLISPNTFFCSDSIIELIKNDEDLSEQLQIMVDMNKINIDEPVLTIVTLESQSSLNFIFVLDNVCYDRDIINKNYLVINKQDLKLGDIFEAFQDY